MASLANSSLTRSLQRRLGHLREPVHSPAIRPCESFLVRHRREVENVPRRRSQSPPTS
jgi:hypothetical protein